jgi:hypothetical protein
VPSSANLSVAELAAADAEEMTRQLPPLACTRCHRDRLPRPCPTADDPLGRRPWIEEALDSLELRSLGSALSHSSSGPLYLRVCLEIIPEAAVHLSKG